LFLSSWVGISQTTEVVFSDIKGIAERPLQIWIAIKDDHFSQAATVHKWTNFATIIALGKGKNINY
jgi:hypothetical protein